jgi:hypothetical protein
MSTKQKKKTQKKKGKKQKGKKSQKKARVYRAVKIKRPCDKCGTMLQPGDVRCRKKKCNAQFEEA